MDYSSIKTPNDLYSFMSDNIKYGFVSNDGHIYTRSKDGNKVYEDMLFTSYYLQRPVELLNSRCGICYDQVQFAKDWLLKNNYLVYTFYCIYHNHTFLVYKDNNKYMLFETSIKNNNGIVEFLDINDLFKYYINSQIKNKSSDNIDIDIYNFDSSPFGKGLYECIDEYKKGNKIKIYK